MLEPGAAQRGWSILGSSGAPGWVSGTGEHPRHKLTKEKGAAIHRIHDKTCRAEGQSLDLCLTPAIPSCSWDSGRKFNKDASSPSRQGPALTSLQHHSSRGTMPTLLPGGREGTACVQFHGSRKDQMNYSTYSVLKFYNWIDSYGSSQTRALVPFRL